MECSFGQTGILAGNANANGDLAACLKASHAPSGLIK
jgi:hypothetical protein